MFTIHNTCYYTVQYLLTWYTKCKWFTSIINTINGYSTSGGTSILCIQIITSYTLCSPTMWEALRITTSKFTISITSCSVPSVSDRRWWCRIHHTCQSDTTQDGIVKCVNGSTNWCTSWITDNSNTWKVLISYNQLFNIMQVTWHCI